MIKEGAKIVYFGDNINSEGKINEETPEKNKQFQILSYYIWKLWNRFRNNAKATTIYIFLN
jgi:hypothetical protein